MADRYRQAGVDIDAGERAVDLIRDLARSTFGPRVLTDLGSFGGLFSAEGFEQPVLVASADGVGTKLKLATRLRRHTTVGRDLVAHCVNDILTSGAIPLFFLDYVAMGRLEPEVVAQVVEGLATECRLQGCALIGGETAEMPGMYAEGEYDLAGFIVGVVRRDRIVDGRTVEAGDAVWGLASSGLHTNGYSLARSALEGLPLDRPADGMDRPLGDVLLEPHRCYLGAMRPLLEAGLVRAMAHITGGGLVGNIPRALPAGLAVELDRDAWSVPPVFELIRQRSDVPDDEMVRVFNLGLGWVFVTAADAGEVVRRLLPEALPVGRVVERGEGPGVRFRGHGRGGRPGR
jgi:phosphoribosylformylglycinamidine cyclo-ligase